MERLGAQISTGTVGIGLTQIMSWIPDTLGYIGVTVGIIASIYVIRKSDASRLKFAAEEERAKAETQKLKIEIEILKNSQNKIITDKNRNPPKN